ncbi:hypothetical protein SS1G_03076 [Sclerotinia sclerotiorum 1980 UF-70]|uniref:CSI2 protein n=2 Tax=Sclerotinia sclerotiorum (strain ATCC 18683 / 1980 / Ss-1) TaxID=665079 RepID=A7ECN7_SCLS1|nr:hypothetical protein SS1G_03076 [Sclerotinia sclerotiorum 1980 UF-70]APA09170.1 hypothetical protein sscle_04g039400 [Sclerotinia sclerotiorum 1980 UF-70]EDO00216.1 hypothetical protein SS1G_03076 [Sclerotinia sclerotiorum 1980 UF-70]
MRFPKSVATAAFAVSFFAMPIIAATTATTAATTATSDLPNLSSVAASEASAAAASTRTTTSSDTTSTGTTTPQSIAVITGGSTTTGKASSTSALPTLAGAYTIPVASVPPTSNAPYMRSSSYPEGTVFIAVGAVLGFMALSVLVWRMMVAWALHRSVKRAASQPSHVDKKQLFQGPPAPFYKYADKESTLSLGGGLGGKSGKKRPTTGNGTQSQTSLFFSPTALAGGNTPGNRTSNYLPAGYYAAGNTVPGAYPGDRQSINMSNLTPQGYTTPSSPTHGTHFESTTSDLRHTDGNVRAPSAYLQDLFDGDNSRQAPQQGGRDRRSTRY